MKGIDFMIFDYPDINHEEISKAINDIKLNTSESKDDLANESIIKIASIGGCHGHNASIDEYINKKYNF